MIQKRFYPQLEDFQPCSKQCWEKVDLPTNASVDEVIEAREKTEWKETHDQTVAKLRQDIYEIIESSDLKAYCNVINRVQGVLPHGAGVYAVVDNLKCLV